MLLVVLMPSIALAEEAQLSGANTAWILTATALVLFMTLPGLALFYGGLVRSKNVLSVLMQCFAIAAVSSLIWLIMGYSLAFGEGAFDPCSLYVSSLFSSVAYRVGAGKLGLPPLR